MTAQLHSTTQYIPSSVLHTSQGVRSHYTRVAARKATANVRKNMTLMLRGLKSGRSPAQPGAV